MIAQGNMNTKYILLSIGLIGCILLSGCVTTQVASKPSIWPLKSSDNWYYYEPKKMSSVDEAIGTIKNLRQNFVKSSAGIVFSSLEVDPYGLRAEWKWTETTQYQEYVPSYGGFFLGWTYVPTYGGSYQTHTQSQQKSDMLIIPFNDVVDLGIWHNPTLNRLFKWGLSVALERNKIIHLRAADERTVYQLADAIATLAMARGKNLTRPKIGIAMTALTPAQSQDLGLLPNTGVLVANVAINSPAHEAGILFLDVILEIDSVPIKTTKDVADAINQAFKVGKKTIPVKVIRKETLAVSTTKDTKVSQTTIVEKTFDVSLEKSDGK